MPARSKCSVDAEWMSWGSTQVRGSWRVPRWPVALQPPGLAPLLLCAPCLAVEERVRAPDPQWWTRILGGKGGGRGGEGRLSGPDPSCDGRGSAQNGHGDCSRSRRAHPRSPHGPVCSDARLALIHTWWASAMGIDSLLAFELLAQVLFSRPPARGSEARGFHTQRLRGPAICPGAWL